MCNTAISIIVRMTAWIDVLSKEESAEYEARAVSELGIECARWLANGER